MTIKAFGGVEEGEKGIKEFGSKMEPVLRNGQNGVMIRVRREFWKATKKALRLLTYV